MDDVPNEIPAPIPALARGLLLALAAAKLVLHALVGSGYGFHQDEFYYLACGRRPTFGYVDQPPLVPLLAHLAETLSGQAAITPFELRWCSALASAGVVFLAGLMARELGGGRFAQGMSALAVLVMPLFLTTGELFETVVFDHLLWAAAFWLVLRTLRTGQARGWLMVGLVAGLGLETKHTMGLFGLGLAVALLATATGRRHLATPWPWLGGGIALALLLPNLLWQHAHGWPTAEFIHNNNAWNRKSWTLPGFLGWQALLVGPVVLPLLALGAWWARGRGGNVGARVVVCISAVVFVTLLALRAKFYYVGPVYPALAAVGSVALESLTARWASARAARGAPARRWLRPALAGAMVLCVLPVVPMVLPVVPRARLAGSWEAGINPDFGMEIGWPELVAQVGSIFRALPPEEQARATILCVDYEEPSAIEHFDPALAARVPVVSPHNNYWLWGPGAGDSPTTLVVGARHREWMDKLWGRVEQVATIDNPLHIPNEQQGRGIWVCREPRQTLRAAWGELKNFD